MNKQSSKITNTPEYKSREVIYYDGIPALLNIPLLRPLICCEVNETPVIFQVKTSFIRPACLSDQRSPFLWRPNT